MHQEQSSLLSRPDCPSLPESCVWLAARRPTRGCGGGLRRRQRAIASDLAKLV